MAEDERKAMTALVFIDIAATLLLKKYNPIRITLRERGTEGRGRERGRECK
jgi:hypothetical protein